MYMNVTMYGQTKLMAADDVDDRQLAGSAVAYLGEGCPDVGMLYAYKFARNCGPEGNKEEYCYEVPYGCCNQQANPERCIGEPGCAGMAENESAMIAWRLYLDPVSKTGADPMEVILDKAIKFSPKD
jgi:hypothetical protein